MSNINIFAAGVADKGSKSIVTEIVFLSSVLHCVMHRVSSSHFIVHEFTAVSSAFIDSFPSL